MDSGATREHYIDVGPSSLLKSLHSIADPKYEGTKTSRKALMEASDEEMNSDMEGDEEGDSHEGGEYDEDDSFGGEEQGESEEGPESASESEGEEENEGTNDEEEHDEHGEKDEHQGDDEAKEKIDDMSSTLKKTKQEDLKKGRAVKDQMDLWDNLLDTRIRLQKSVVQTNVLPLPSDIKVSEMADIQDAIMGTLLEASSLLEDIFKLQEGLITANDIVQPPPRKRRKMEEEQCDLDFYREYFAESTEDAAALEQALHPYTTRTLAKWSAKIQAVAPSVLLPSNRGAFSKGAQNLKSAIQLMDETLVNDREKLLTRTQTLRSKTQRIGAPMQEDSSDPIVDAEIYDDTDFYQKILRDIIDSRSGNEGQEDWLTLQKQKKAKKKVDTKASKGRKLRYEVHEKLQNFMVPVPVPGAWHDEQIDELFSSLLGKGFENLQMNSEKAPNENIDLSGFKVFG
ncbi:apoptosis-antagonizing transcription factor [Panaeolus papilionaceus]|nr:apoptosis-antagonizing transcription factor [Panaeolus papilionaceus]